MKTVSTNGMSKADWLQGRCSTIGTSDASGILGLSPYTNAYDVYVKKVEGETFEGNEVTRYGLEMEDICAKRFTEETGLKTIKDNKIRYHRCDPGTDPWLSTNLDRVVITPEGRCPLEIKTVRDVAKKSWDGDFPSWYKCQIMGQMAITGWHTCYVYVHIYGSFGIDFEIMQFHFDEDYWKESYKKLEHFWFENVLKRIPPEPTSESNIKHLYPKAEEGSVITLSDPVEKAIEELEEVKAEILRANKQKKDLEVLIKKEIGEAETMMNDKYVVTYKNSKGRSTFNKKSFGLDHPELLKEYTSNGNSYRTLKIKEAK